MFHTLYATPNGLMYDHPGLAAAGRSGRRVLPLGAEELVPLPAGATLVLLPGAQPVGFRRGRQEAFGATPDGDQALAVAACLPAGFTRTHLPAYHRRQGKPLPILGYTAVAWRDGRIWAAARLTDDPAPWSPKNYNTPDLPQLVRKRLAAAPNNTLLAGLGRCALQYRCFTAQNIFYRRWEGGLPVSPACNARCLGCLSGQEEGGPPAPQQRVRSVPALEDVVAVGTEHLARAPRAIISFGQGCEGEPLAVAPFLAKAVAAMRRRTARGTINLNSNAGHTEGLAAVAAAGLDSLRVSLISATPATYEAYHRPSYRLEDVRRSIKLAVRQGVYTSLNLLVYPGLTDCPSELEALLDLVQDTGLHMIQLRNLNIDPALMEPLLPAETPLGVARLIDRLRRMPGLAVGNFSRAVSRTARAPRSGHRGGGRRPGGVV